MLAEIEMKKQILAEERKIEDDKAKNAELYQITAKVVFAESGLISSLMTAGFAYEAIVLGIAASGGSAAIFAAITAAFY